jgi:type I restriction enzyme S subunit
MPKNWKTYKLGELITTLTDYHANGAYKKLKANVELRPEKDFAIMIRTTNFEKNNFEDNIYLDEQAYNFLAKTKAYPGDVLMNKIANPGTVYFLPDLKSPVSVGMNLFLLRFAEELIDPYYIYQYLKANEAYVKSFSAGSVTKTITKDAVRNLDVAIPPLPEQCAIASILSALDDKKELNLQMNKTLAEMAMTLYKHWFVDFGPFKNGKFVESELGMIPEGWEVKTIYDLMDVIYGAPFKSKQFNEDGLGYPLIRIRDLKTNSPKFYTEEDHKKKTVIKAGDVLAGMDAEFDPYIWLGDEAVLNQRVVYFKPKHENVVRRYIYEAVKPWLKYFAGAKVGTTVIHLGKGDVDTFKFIFPNDQTILKEFNSQMENIHELIVNNGEEIKTLTKTRDTLLPKLISGKVRVKQAEEIIKSIT